MTPRHSTSHRITSHLISAQLITSHTSDDSETYSPTNVGIHGAGFRSAKVEAFVGTSTYDKFIHEIAWLVLISFLV